MRRECTDRWPVGSMHLGRTNGDGTGMGMRRKLRPTLQQLDALSLLLRRGRLDEPPAVVKLALRCDVPLLDLGVVLVAEDLFVQL